MALSGYLITTDKNKIDVELVHRYLSKESYWSENIPLEFVKTSIEHSVCFSIFFKEQQVGFARVITDMTTFGYIADVFIIDSHKSRGLGKWLMQSIMDHADFKQFRSWMLATKDAHGLYEKFGFKLTNDTTRIMRKQGIEGYGENGQTT